MNPENIGSAAADDAEQQKELANLGIRWRYVNTTHPRGECFRYCTNDLIYKDGLDVLLNKIASAADDSKQQKKLLI